MVGSNSMTQRLTEKMPFRPLNIQWDILRRYFMCHCKPKTILDTFWRLQDTPKLLEKVPQHTLRHLMSMSSSISSLRWKYRPNTVVFTPQANSAIYVSIKEYLTLTYNYPIHRTKRIQVDIIAFRLPVFNPRWLKKLCKTFSATHHKLADFRRLRRLQEECLFPH